MIFGPFIDFEYLTIGTPIDAEKSKTKGVLKSVKKIEHKKSGTSLDLILGAICPTLQGRSLAIEPCYSGHILIEYDVNSFVDH